MIATMARSWCMSTLLSSLVVSIFGVTRAQDRGWRPLEGISFERRSSADCLREARFSLPKKADYR